MLPRPSLRILILLAAALPGIVAAESPSPQVPSLAGSSDPAARQISVTAQTGLTRTVDLPTESLQEARRDLLADLPLSDADLRALADHWDGLAALRYVRRLIDSQPHGSDSDIAYYGSIAVATGRIWPLADVTAALRRLDPVTEPPERIMVYADMLYAHAWAGNSLALDAVIDLNGEGRLFGPLSDATRARLLEIGDKRGDGRVALHMAMSLLQAPSLTEDQRRHARNYLNRAQGGNDLSVQTVAATLLRRLDGVLQQETPSP